MSIKILILLFTVCNAFILILINLNKNNKHINLNLKFILFILMFFSLSFTKNIYLYYSTINFLHSMLVIGISFVIIIFVYMKLFINDKN
jgi:hypothetical protein